MRNDTIFGPHNHTCKCGVTWFHDPIEVISLNLAERYEEASQINQASHCCPSCKREEYQIDDNEVNPQFLHDGKVCLPIAERVPTVDTLETHTKREKQASQLRMMRLLEMLGGMGGDHA